MCSQFLTIVETIDSLVNLQRELHNRDQDGEVDQFIQAKQKIDNEIEQLYDDLDKSYNAKLTNAQTRTFYLDLVKEIQHAHARRSVYDTEIFRKLENCKKLILAMGEHERFSSMFFPCIEYEEDYFSGEIRITFKNSEMIFSSRVPNVQQIV